MGYRGSAGACAASGDNARRAVNPPATFGWPFALSGSVVADAKPRSGFSRSLRSKRRQRPRGGKSPGHLIDQHLIRKHKLGVPQSSRDVFTLIAGASFIPADLAEQLKKMVGFCNIAMHEYQRLQLPITEHIMQHRLVDFQRYCQLLLTNPALLFSTLARTSRQVL